MRIAVFGLGYVGAVSAACLAEWGHLVIGVDKVSRKVDLVNRGESPIVEPGIDEIVAAQVAVGRLRATEDWQLAVADTDMAWVCVGTPSGRNGRPDLRHVRQVAEQIGLALRERSSPYQVVLRSTLLPGTTRKELIPVLEKSAQRRVGEGFEVLYHPEFLREGSAISDFREPSRVIVGAAEGAEGSLREVYGHVAAAFIRTEIEVAEILKYAENAWHALKVTFANEIGSLSKSMSIDGREVMEILCRDAKLNLSASYLRPGLSFGGSCLPKDLRSLCHAARHQDVELPVIRSVLPSNEQHLERAFELITRHGKRRIGMLGLTFKPGTDDLRESPLVEIAERLIGQGYDLRIYDPNVDLGRIDGANRAFVETRIAHIAAVMSDRPDDVVGHSEVLVLGHQGNSYLEGSLPEGENPTIVDLAGSFQGDRSSHRIHGICW